jgi:hypothetical protein
MVYTWPNISRIHGGSETNLGRHMRLHPCCKKTSKRAVIHPLNERPLIIDALPIDIQAKIWNRFGGKHPEYHPFPKSFETWFEEVDILKDMSVWLIMKIIKNRILKPMMMAIRAIRIRAIRKIVILIQ